MLAIAWGAVIPQTPNGWAVVLALVLGTFEVLNRLLDTASFRRNMMQEIGRLKAKDVEQQALIDRLERKLDASEAETRRQQNLKHDALQEVHACHVVIQIYRVRFGQDPGDTIDLTRAAARAADEPEGTQTQ